MRLIDADAFKQEIAAITIANGYDPKIPNLLCELIDLQPAAYDADQVTRDSGSGGWIPVSVRLPGEGEEVLVCLSNGDVDIDLYDEKEGFFFYGENLQAIAWQPLPEPYREEGSK
jgi:hypothetical protein